MIAARIEAVITITETLRRVVIAADPQALTVAEMIAAMRDGLGRRANVFPIPPRLLEIPHRAADQGESYDRISGSLVADPSVLISLHDGFEVPTPPNREPGRRSGGALAQRSLAFRVASYRKKLGHDIIATTMAAQKASTAQFE
jgi:hypothetical protein